MLLNGYNVCFDNFVWSFEAIDGLPVIITVPHSLSFPYLDLLGFFQTREKGAKGNDGYIWTIVKDILLRIKVNAVRGCLPRHFVDYNRSPDGINYYPLSQNETETSLDDFKLLPFYNYYHKTINQIIWRMIQDYGRKNCLLMDIHGFSKQPSYGEYNLILGTGNRKTVHSDDIDYKLADFLVAKRNYCIFLPGEEFLGPLEDIYSADFTTRHYAEEFGIDAIQIEIAKKFRVKEGAIIGQTLSSDLADFFRLYYGYEV